MMELATLVLKASLILVAAAAAAFFSRKGSAALRHCIWTAALAGLLALPLASVLLPELPLLPPMTWAAQDGSGSIGELLGEPDGQPARHGSGGDEIQQATWTGAGADSGRADSPTSAHRLQPRDPNDKTLFNRLLNSAWTAWILPASTADDPSLPVMPRGLAPILSILIVAVWAAGTAFMLARLLREWAGLRRIAADAGDWPPNALGNALHRMGVRQEVGLLLSGSLEIPMTTGTLRPLILLPAGAQQWPPERLTTVLLHEGAHIARRDHIWNLLGAAALSLFWFHPLAWRAARQQRLEGDRACDDLVLESGVDALRYADELLLFARALPSRRLAAPALADRSGLRTRLQSILDATRARGPMRPASLALLAALGLLLLVPVAALSQGEPATAAGAPQGDKGATAAQPLPLTVQEALAQLTFEDPAQRRRASWILGEKEDPAAVPALIEALADPSAEVRAMAAWALGEIKDPNCLPALAALAGDAENRVREMAALALGELETHRTLPHLSVLAADPDPAVRSASIWALGETGGPQARQGILKALSDASAQVRLHAAQTLGQKRMSEASALRGILTDASPQVRREAARSLGLLRASSAVEDLARALEDPDPVVRRESATALGRIGKPAALDSLLTALDDPDLQVREQAVWALDEIRSE